MAFTGTPVVTSLGKNIVRITGLSLAAAAAGTIGLAGGAGQVSLPSSFPSSVDAQAQANGLSMTDMVELRFQRGVGGTQAAKLNVDKAAAPFLLTITNPDGANVSGPLDIYVQYFWSGSR